MSKMGGSGNPAISQKLLFNGGEAALLFSAAEDQKYACARAYN